MQSLLLISALLVGALSASVAVASETDALGLVHGFQRDYLGQLTGETHPDLGTAGIAYKYDLNGNRTQVTRNGLIEFYDYDFGDRLKWTNTGAPTAPNQPPTSNQSAAYGIYGWDDFGQLQRRERRDKAGLPVYKLDFYWDTASRLRQVKQLGATASQAVIFTGSYAADGERISKTERQGSIAQDHVYSFGLHDTNGNTAYTPGFAHRSRGSDRFYHQDWLGSARYLTDAPGGGSGTLGYASAARFDAFGQRTAVAGTDGTYGTDRQYAGAWGYERERPGGAELGLDYLYQRYYDPAIGRFITRDPIRWAGGLNLYGYVGNDPVGFVDPWGLTGRDLRGLPNNDITRLMENLRRDIDKRIVDLIRDEDRLPWSKAGAKMRESIQGHVRIINERKAQYTGALRELEGRLGGPLSELERPWLTHKMPCPPKGSARPPTPAGGGRMTGSGGGSASMVTIGVGLGAGAEAATYALKWRKRIDRATSRAMNSDAADPAAGY